MSKQQSFLGWWRMVRWQVVTVGTPEPYMDAVVTNSHQTVRLYSPYTDVMADCQFEAGGEVMVLDDDQNFTVPPAPFKGAVIGIIPGRAPLEFAHKLIPTTFGDDAHREKVGQFADAIDALDIVELRDFCCRILRNPDVLSGLARPHDPNGVAEQAPVQIALEAHERALRASVMLPVQDQQIVAAGALMSIAAACIGNNQCADVWTGARHVAPEALRLEVAGPALSRLHRDWREAGEAIRHAWTPRALRREDGWLNKPVIQAIDHAIGGPYPVDVSAMKPQSAAAASGWF